MDFAHSSARSPVRIALGLLALVVIAFGPSARAQSTIVNPGAEAAKAAAKSGGGDNPAPEKERQSSYEMQSIDIVGKLPPKYKDDELIGDYAQPRWTAHRHAPAR